MADRRAMRRRGETPGQGTELQAAQNKKGGNYKMKTQKEKHNAIHRT